MVGLDVMLVDFLNQNLIENFNIHNVNNNNRFTFKNKQTSNLLMKYSYLYGEHGFWFKYK